MWVLFFNYNIILYSLSNTIRSDHLVRQRIERYCKHQFLIFYQYKYLQLNIILLFLIFKNTFNRDLDISG